MAIRRTTPSSASLTGGDLSVDVLHTEDSVQIGDGTNLLGTFASVGGTRSLPVDVKQATVAALTDGTQKCAIYDPGVADGGIAEVDLVGAERALKVSVIATVGGGSGGTASTDSGAFTVTSTQFTPIGGYLDDVASDALAEGEMGAVRMTSARALHVYAANNTDPATATLQGTGNTALSAIKTSVELIDDAVFTDNAGYTDNSSKLLATGFIYDEVAGTALTENDIAAARINVNRAQVHILEDGATRGRYATVSASNALKVDNSGVTQPISDASQIADNGGFTDGTSKVLPAGYIFDDVAGTALTENDVGAARMDSKRSLMVTLEDATTRGQKATVSAAGAVKVDGSAVTQPVSGTAANCKVDIGLINAVTPLMGAGNTGTGSLRVTIATDQANFTTPLNVNKTQIGGVAISTGTGVMGTGVQRVAIASDNDALTVKQATAANFNAQVVGNVAHDGGVSGNPVRIAGRAMLANGTAVAEDDVADLATDNQGRAVITLHAPRDLITHAQTTITASAAETTILAAGAAGVFHDLTNITITNSSATAALVTIKDATAGTTRIIVNVPAAGGIVIPMNVPMNQAAAAGNWTATCTSVSSLYFYVQAVKRIA